MSDTPDLEPIEPLPPEELPSIDVQSIAAQHAVDGAMLEAVRLKVTKKLEERGPISGWTEPLQPVIVFFAARYLQRHNAPVTEADVNRIYDQVQRWLDQVYQNLDSVLG